MDLLITTRFFIAHIATNLQFSIFIHDVTSMPPNHPVTTCVFSNNISIQVSYNHDKFLGRDLFSPCLTYTQTFTLTVVQGWSWRRGIVASPLGFCGVTVFSWLNVGLADSVFISVNPASIRGPAFIWTRRLFEAWCLFEPGVYSRPGVY